MMKEITLSEAQLAASVADAAEEAFLIDEQSFRIFYDRTARPLWSYLYRVSGNGALADDLMQESYYRLLRKRLPEISQDYLKNYLFRIATNLLRDHWRRGKNDPVWKAHGCGHGFEHQTERDQQARIPSGLTEDSIHQRSELQRALECLKPRERELLWLAYVEGSSHREISEIVHLKEGSIRPLLFRARRKLASLLRSTGVRLTK